MLDIYHPILWSGEGLSSTIRPWKGRRGGGRCAEIPNPEHQIPNNVQVQRRKQGTGASGFVLGLLPLAAYLGFGI
jgi:hypothetical protein